MKSIYRPIVLVFGAFLSWPVGVFADYTLVLKNGGRITVESYRQEGEMIKFRGLGGEIAISRDQIQSILRDGTSEERGLRLPPAETSSIPAIEGQKEKGIPEPGRGLPLEEKREAPTRTEEKPLTQEQRRAKEESEYQKTVAGITEQLKAANDRYSLITRGSASPDPSLLNSEDAIRARTDDLNSRLRDGQYNPAGPSDAGVIRLLTPSPFAGTPPATIELQPGGVIPRVDSPPPAYSERERELSDLRNQINTLTKERERLIQEMREKSFNPGARLLE